MWERVVVSNFPLWTSHAETRKTLVSIAHRVELGCNTPCPKRLSVYLSYVTMTPIELTGGTFSLLAFVKLTVTCYSSQDRNILWELFSPVANPQWHTIHVFTNTSDVNNTNDIVDDVTQFSCRKIEEHNALVTAMLLLLCPTSSRVVISFHSYPAVWLSW